MPKFAKLTIGIDYSIAGKIFKKDQEHEVDEELYTYLSDNPQFETFDRDDEDSDNEDSDNGNDNNAENDGEDPEEDEQPTKKKRRSKRG